MAPRRPRDRSEYVSRDEAVAFLMGAAGRIAEAAPDVVFKLSLTVSAWSDDWTKRRVTPAARREGGDR